MKKLFMILLFLLALPTLVSAQTDTYTVQKGDTLWKIAVRFQVGFHDILNANPMPNHNLIYPGQKIKIPNYDATKSVENQVIALTNQERAKHGLPALSANWELSRIARIKSQDMKQKNYFSHTSPTYGSPFDMIKSFGLTYKSAAENIAQGQRTPQEVVNAWMNSSGHRANILSSNYKEIGVGYHSEGNYWTQMFITR